MAEVKVKSSYREIGKDTRPDHGKIVAVKKWRALFLGTYYHFGVAYYGDVIHFWSESDSKSKAKICKTSLNDFLGDASKYTQIDDVRIEGQSKIRAASDSETASRASDSIGKFEGEYSPFSKNCEHFAWWCKFGTEYSSQVNLKTQYIIDLLDEFNQLLNILSNI